MTSCVKGSKQNNRNASLVVVCFSNEGLGALPLILCIFVFIVRKMDDEPHTSIDEIGMSTVKALQVVCVVGISQFFGKRGVSCAGFCCEELVPLAARPPPARPGKRPTARGATSALVHVHPDSVCLLAGPGPPGRWAWHLPLSF